MILLDTNIIYYAVGLSQNNMIDLNLLKTEISNNTNVYISSLTVFEILNHFRKKANVVRRIFTYLKQENI